MYIVLKLLAVAEGVVLQLLHVLLHSLHINKDTGHRISAGLDLDSELWIWLYDLPEIGVTELGVEPLANQGDYPLGLVGGESHVKGKRCVGWDECVGWQCNLVQQVVLELGGLRRAVCLAEVRGVEGMVLVAMEGRHTDDVSVTSLEDWCPCYTKVGVLTLTQLQYGSVGQSQSKSKRSLRSDFRLNSKAHH